MKDYYGLLEVHPKASAEAIKQAYKLMVLKYHPVVLQREKVSECFYKMQELEEAYEVLTDRDARRKYDKEYFAHFSQSVDESKYKYYDCLRYDASPMKKENEIKRKEENVKKAKRKDTEKAKVVPKVNSKDAVQDKPTKSKSDVKDTKDKNKNIEETKVVPKVESKDVVQDKSTKAKSDVKDIKDTKETKGSKGLLIGVILAVIVLAGIAVWYMGFKG